MVGNEYWSLLMGELQKCSDQNTAAGPGNVSTYKHL